MHAFTTAPALAVAFAMGGCAPTPTTTGSEPPSARNQPLPAAIVATSPPANPASAPMGKRAAPQPGEAVSPIIAARGGGKGWEIQISNTDGYAHRVELIRDNGPPGGGVAIFQPSGEASNAHMLLRGTIGAQDLTIELQRQSCTSDDGVAHEHAFIVTIGGMTPMRGCGDLAI